ncbi:hypothetical protein BCR44DRAFT_1428690 [Catenaria anguillulae PL171]|uniref:RRM domain-containing protein n=1 Tax=Catenaria anguillulae PL171 TaxID=765915 RepID=A0A1Y2HVM8_9FUNG|nr:hypothetical protein BCR44DRAFT_1428690 [Catenaria anguillulae PL171]
MKNIRPSVTPDQVLDFFTHICPLSLVHIHLPDRPAKFPGRKAVLVFNDKYDADAFYHQLTLRVETGELDEMFALTQADMDAWARQFPQLAGDDPFGYKRVPLRLDVSRHTMPVPQPIVGPNAAPVASASGANGWVGVESWRPSARMATRVDEPMKVASWRRKKDEQQEVVAAQDEQESSSSSSPSSEDDEEEKEDEKDRGGWLPARARASRN